MRRRWLITGGITVAATIAIATGTVLWRASRTLTESARQVTSEGVIRFSQRALDRALPDGFEELTAASGLRDAVFTADRLWVSDSAGLSAYTSEGVLLQRYSAGKELPSAPLAAMAAAPTGKLWIAMSGEGLLSYENGQLQQFRPEIADYRKMTTLLPLSDGRVLIGTEKKGVLSWNGKQFEAFHESLTDQHVTALAGSASSLWVGTLQHGLVHWTGGRAEVFGEVEGLPDAHVLSLAVRGDQVFAGTGGGIALFERGAFRQVLAPDLMARALLPLDGELLVGTLEDGIVHVSLSANPGRAPRSNAAACTVCQIEKLMLLDGRPTALAEDGLYEIARRGLRVVLKRPESVLTDRNVSALSLDSTGHLWIGYFDRGLDILDRGSTHATHVENDHVFCVNRIAQDRVKDETAVATANGLVLFDGSGRERQVLGRSDGLIANQITDVLFRSGGMTVATPAGITSIDGGGTTSIYAFQGLANNHVFALAAFGDRTLAGTLGGLSVLDKGSVSGNYTTANSGLKHNWITSIVRVGDDWFIGTYGAGVVRFDRAARWESFAELGAPTIVNPNAMLVTRRGVYAGTLGNGLAVYDRAYGRWRKFTAGLPSSNVTAIEFDGSLLYIGTDNGLVKVAEQNLIHP